jgi:hypothetical protein
VDVYELVTLAGGSSTVWIGSRGRDGIELTVAVARQVVEALLRAADFAEGQAVTVCAAGSKGYAHVSGSARARTPRSHPPWEAQGGGAGPIAPHPPAPKE